AGRVPIEQRLARVPAVTRLGRPDGAVPHQAVERRRAVAHRPQHRGRGRRGGLVEQVAEVAAEHRRAVDGGDVVGARPGGGRRGRGRSDDAAVVGRALGDGGGGGERSRAVRAATVGGGRVRGP